MGSCISIFPFFFPFFCCRASIQFQVFFWHVSFELPSAFLACMCQLLVFMWILYLPPHSLSSASTSHLFSIFFSPRVPLAQYSVRYIHFLSFSFERRTSSFFLFYLVFKQPLSWTLKKIYIFWCFEIFTFRSDCPREGGGE